MTTSYLAFVTATLDTLMDRKSGQSLRWGGAPQAPWLPTVCSQVVRKYTSAGGINPDGTMYRIYLDTILPGEATRLDTAAIPLIERVAKATGNARFSDLAAYVDHLLGVYAFDPGSGMPYISSECEIDVRFMGPGFGGGRDYPRFKPTNEMHLDRLWRVAPEKVVRGAKAAYYGLITRPETFDFNRFTYYGFDDSKKKHQLDFDPNQVAFATSAAWMTKMWAFVFAKTGDAETLSWATRMGEKWLALQNPRTGLVPHFLGAKLPTETGQTPQPYCHHHDVLTALAYLEAADYLDQRPQGQAIAAKLRKLGLELTRGIARHAYDKQLKIFYNWIKTADGSSSPETIIYTFFSQEQKDYWVNKDPTLSTVEVCPGLGFYKGTAPWDFFCGAGIAPLIAKVGEKTRDAEIISLTKDMAEEFIAQRAELVRGPILPNGYWVFAESGSNIQALVALHRATGEKRWLDAARKIGDQELEYLARPEAQGENEHKVVWWRWPRRTALLTAMLDLHDAVAAA